MNQEELVILEKRKAGFDEFYEGLIPTLVDFVGKLGINPAHEVLKNAVQFAPYLDRALKNIDIVDDQDRVWLLTRMGYFIGEYFVQKFSGSWFVNGISGSRYFGRYVVGQFASLGNATVMLDPFEVAQVFVERPVPRQLDELLTEVERELSDRRS